MENLIKSILEQLSIIANKRSEAQPSELLKTLPNGQWELLNKAGEVPSVKPPAPPNMHKEMLSHLFEHTNKITNFLNTNHPKTANVNKLSTNIPISPYLQVLLDHHEETTGKRPELHSLDAARGAIKDYALNLPKGKVDLGHLGKLREAQTKLTDGPYSERSLNHEDMAEIINHHFGDAPSLKYIHDHGGGTDAIETLVHTMGANGIPQRYSSLMFKNPQLHHDLLHLINPPKQAWENTYGPRMEDPELGKLYSRLYRRNISEEERGRLQTEIEAREEDISKKSPPIESTYENTPATPEHDAIVHTAHQRVMNYDENDNAGYDNPVYTKALTNAAAARAVDRFKRHHKLY